MDHNYSCKLVKFLTTLRIDFRRKPFYQKMIHQTPLDDSKSVKNRGNKLQHQNQIKDCFSRKVFVGGLPNDIHEDEITAVFFEYGPLTIDWPYKADLLSKIPPRGYVFLLFQDEKSVEKLVHSCKMKNGKYYTTISSKKEFGKMIEIRPWKLNDADYVLNASNELDPRKTVFIGGIPRRFSAAHLALVVDDTFGGVCYAGIDTDLVWSYPKGAGRVTFFSEISYLNALQTRFVETKVDGSKINLEMKPYVLEDVMCDICNGQECSDEPAILFCGNLKCLSYLCVHCWSVAHSVEGKKCHKPLVKEGYYFPLQVLRGE